MEGRAAAPAAGTVLNALANGYGSAFARAFSTVPAAGAAARPSIVTTSL